jgi:hypothetical protein
MAAMAMEEVVTAEAVVAAAAWRAQLLARRSAAHLARWSARQQPWY